MTFTRQPVDYCLDRSLPEMEQWMSSLGYTPDMPLAVDIETPETDKINEEDSDDPERTSYTIIRCGFSFRSGSAASYPWSEPYISFTRNLLSKAINVVMHNSGFDRPRLNAANCPTLGRVIDTMWMFHFLQSDLPKSLEFVAPFYTDVAPWKHLSQAEPAFYNATDNDVTLRCFEAMRDWLIRQGRWERFLRHCSDTAEILGEMSAAGVLVDVAARQTLQDGLRAEIAVLDSQIQAAVPRELLPVKELKTERTLAELPESERAEWEAHYIKCECKRVRKSTQQCIICDGTGMTIRFRKRLGFNWNSTDQCQELAKHYKFTIPKKRGEDREALESKTLRTFGKRKPVFLDIWNARKRYKLISTYDWLGKTVYDTIDLEVPIAKEAEGCVVGRGTDTAQKGCCTPLEQQTRGTGVFKEATQEAVGCTVSRGKEGKGETLAGEPQELFKPYQAVDIAQGEGSRTALEDNTRVRGVWVGATPKCKDLSEVPTIIRGREATHPSLGLGSLQQYNDQSYRSLQFVPHKFPPTTECPRSLLLPVERESAAYISVHTTYGFWPSTWRKGSRNPNLQNIPKRSELAAAFRRTIVAAPGHVLIEADSAAIEAVIVGYCAQSPRYIRACKAGIHDIFMSHVRASREGGRGIDIALADKDLIDACRAAKKEDASRPLLEQIRDACKRCIHGTNYGLSPFGMHDEYPDEFASLKVATELQEMYLSLFPDIKRWMRTTREQADRQTFLDNHYQYRHYFYAVTKWNSKYQRFDLGTDAKRCVAYLPQSDASAIQTEDLLTLADNSIVRTMLRLVIHDSFVLETPIDMVDYTCGVLHSTMSRPRPELGGLEIGVEIKVGDNLQDTEVWKP